MYSQYGNGVGTGAGAGLDFYNTNYSENIDSGYDQTSSNEQDELSTGFWAAMGTGGYNDERPLLEELGINFHHIRDKTSAVLNPFGQIDRNLMEDSDMAGPILFCLLFGVFLLLSGKSNFGYVYGVALIGSVSLHFVLNLMSMIGIDFIRTSSVLGYCLLPLVVASAFGLFSWWNKMVLYGIYGFAICWCTYAASAIFVVILQLNDMRPLVAYPLALFYSVFAVISVFASPLSIE